MGSGGWEHRLGMDADSRFGVNDQSTDREAVERKQSLIRAFATRGRKSGREQRACSLRLTQGRRQEMKERSSWETEGQPSRRKVRSKSARRISSARATPASPAAAKP